jgi:hypothetical protein
MNVFMMVMLATTPNTAMWRRVEGTIDVGYLSGFAVYMSITWIAYLLVQGSDPGFIDREAYEKAYQGSLGNSSDGDAIHPKNQQPISADDMEIELTVSRKKPSSFSRTDDLEAGGSHANEDEEKEEEKQELEDDEIEVDLKEPEGEDEIDLSDDDAEDDSSAMLVVSQLK